MYLCDRDDLFKIAYEIDRILINRGIIIVMDFAPPFPYKNKYIHHPNVYSFKMDYSKMFSWNPFYTIIYNQLFSLTDTCYFTSPDDRLSVTVLKKEIYHAYPENPF